MLELFIVILGIAAAYAFFEWLDRREVYGRDYERCEACGRKVRGEERVISAPDSKVTVLLIPTNEELMIAMDTAALVG